MCHFPEKFIELQQQMGVRRILLNHCNAHSSCTLGFELLSLALHFGVFYSRGM